MSRKFKDEIRNWTEIANKSGCGVTFKLDKNFKKHYIKPCMMISIIGGTGSGKTNALVDFLTRKNEAFYEVTIFSGSTVDEPLINFLQERLDGRLNLIDDADELPELASMNEEDKKHEKLIVFDDIINLPKKQLTKIQKWFNSSRKYGYTCIAMAQNYTDLPIQMRRNTMIFILFRLNDTNSINQILRTHVNNGDDKEAIRQAYYEATANKGNFFLIDFTSQDCEHRYRHNFTNFIHIPKTFSHASSNGR